MLIKICIFRQVHVPESVQTVQPSTYTTSSMLSICSKYGFGDPSTSCFVYFGDEDTDEGCSLSLQRLIKYRLPGCSAVTNVSVAIQLFPEDYGRYRIHGPTFGINEHSVSNNVHKYSVASEAASSNGYILPWQVAIDSALLGRNLSVTVGFLPQQAYSEVRKCLLIVLISINSSNNCNNIFLVVLVVYRWMYL